MAFGSRSNPVGRLVSVTLTFALGGCAEDPTLLEKIQDRGELVIVTDDNWYPQSCCDDDDDGVCEPDGECDESVAEWSGFDVDVGKEIANRLGVVARFTDRPWDDVIGGNWRGEFDVHIGSASFTTERNEDLHFIQPAYRFDTAYFAAQPGAYATYADIASSSTVCVTQDSTWDQWVSGTLDLGEAGTIYESAPEFATVTRVSDGCAEGVISGDYDLTVVTDFTVLDEIQAEPPTLELIDHPLFAEDIFITVDRSHAESSESLRARIAEILEEMRTDGTLTDLSIEYYGIDLTTPPN